MQSTNGTPDPTQTGIPGLRNIATKDDITQLQTMQQSIQASEQPDHTHEEDWFGNRYQCGKQLTQDSGASEQLTGNRQGDERALKDGDKS